MGGTVAIDPARKLGPLHGFAVEVNKYDALVVEARNLSSIYSEIASFLSLCTSGDRDMPVCHLAHGRCFDDSQPDCFSDP